MGKEKKKIILINGKYNLLDLLPNMVFRPFREDELIPDKDQDLPIIIQNVNKEIAKLRNAMSSLRDVTKKVREDVLWFPEETFFSEQTIQTVQGVGGIISNVLVGLEGIAEIYDLIFDDATKEIINTIDEFRNRLREEEMNPEDLIRIENASKRAIDEFKRFRKEIEEE